MIASQIRLFLLNASLPSELFKLCCIIGKNAIAGISKEEIYSISSFNKSKENLCIPGIDSIGSFLLLPKVMKIG